MAESRIERSAGWPRVLLGVLLLLTGVIVLQRAMHLRYDFHHFYRDAAYVWEHGALNPDLDNADPLLRRQLPFYLPVVPLGLSPMAAGGVEVAAVLWTAMQLVSLVACWFLLSRWVLPPGAWWGWLPAIPVLWESARFSQLGLPVLALVLLGVRALERGRDIRAGAWLAIAIVLKLLPALFVPWLLLKRRWVAAGSCVGVGLVVTLLPCVAVFGPARTGGYLGEWWQHNVAGAPARGMTDTSLRAHFIDHRNQSLPAIVARATVAEHPHPAAWQPLHLSAATASRVGLLGLAALAVAGAWLLRRPIGRDGPAGALQKEASLVLLGMLVLGPLLRTYYLVWAIPALLQLTGRALAGSLAGRIGVVLWLLGMLGWASEAARGYGVHWMMLVGVGLALRASAGSERGERDSAKG